MTSGWIFSRQIQLKRKL